jgi:uncharacterized protein YccT (UPF0319 family)
MNDQVATKQDLRDLESSMGTKFDAKLDVLKQEIMAFSRNLQTELLRFMEGLVRASEARLQRLEAGLLTLHADDGARNGRIANLEARLLEVEKKLLMQP